MSWNLQTLSILETITQVIFLGGVLIAFIVYRAVQTSEDKKKNSDGENDN